MLPGPLKTVAATCAALLAIALLTPLLLAVLLAVFGWNWARAPLEDLALRKTGRALQIRGDLRVQLAWPTPHILAREVTYANPPWATEPQMLEADAVEVTLDLPTLLRGSLSFPELRLTKPRLFLEQGDGGRKTWLLDRAQTDERMRIPIGRVRLDQGAVTYLHAAQRTALHVALSTTQAVAEGGRTAAEAAAGAVVFTATGQFRGEPLVARGSGGAVMRWRDESLPYPIALQAAVGRTRVQADGTVTGLRQLTALDLRLELQGDSLGALLPLTGVALPATPAYRAGGHLRHSGTVWRFESLSGEVGRSDFAGMLQVSAGPVRPLLSGELTSRRLDLADLGPAMGAQKPTKAGKPVKTARPASGAAARDAAGTEGPAAASPAASRGRPRVLPDMPLGGGTRGARWSSVDTDVSLKALTLIRPRALPLDGLQVRLRLKDRLLVLDPLAFDLAGGRLSARVTLDGRTDPMQGHVKALLRGLQLARLLPAVDLRRASIGQLNGEAELKGEGASLGRMLATADGRVSLVAQDGEISRLLLEQMGLHLFEILRLNLGGDERVHVNCAVADFGVERGVMKARALVLDTSINTLVGSGTIDLASETLDLTFNPRTKVSSLLALRSPFYVKGPFSRPVVELDTGRMAARGAGALALGLLNPLLALIPLFEAGPGIDSACGRLLRNAQTALPKVPS